jgi:hypothetical protein
LGYLPSPFLYGVVSNLGGGPDSRLGMMMLMFWTIIGNVLLQLALVFKSKYFKETDVECASPMESTYRESLLGRQAESYISRLKPEPHVNLDVVKEAESQGEDDDDEYLHVRDYPRHVTSQRVYNYQEEQYFNSTIGVEDDE